MRGQSARGPVCGRGAPFRIDILLHHISDRRSSLWLTFRMGPDATFPQTLFPWSPLHDWTFHISLSENVPLPVLVISPNLDMVSREHTRRDVLHEVTVVNI